MPTGRPAALLPEAWISVDGLERPSKQCFRVPVGPLADGAELSIPVNVIAGRSPRPVVVVVAGVHGDESEGPAALTTIWNSLEPEVVTGTLIVVPVLNLPAFRLGQRRGPDDGVDLNRIFPGNPDGTTTSRIAHAFMQCVARGADFILSMHGWSVGYGLTPYVEYPLLTSVTSASHQAALHFGLPFVNPLDAGPGRLLTEVSSLGIPIIEVEIGGGGISLDSQRALYERGILLLLRHLGVTGGPCEDLQPATYVERLECFASREGILRPCVAPGDVIRGGQPLARIYDLSLTCRETICSPGDGLVGILRQAANVTLGSLIATIFRPVSEPASTPSSDGSPANRSDPLAGTA
jgi:N-alpha-acetyl-L-2,4-diaminobutyrate deacetylase